MASAQKKVIVRRFLGDGLPGYLPQGSFVRQGAIDLLDLHGRISPLPLTDVKYVAYVRDFNLGDNASPERLSRRTFLARPRSEGLWIRITFRNPPSAASDLRSPDLLEGLASTDISLLDELLADVGVHLTPPDVRSNTQRLFVPRSAIAELQILAVVTSPSKKKPATSVVSSLQEDLFPAAPIQGPHSL